MHAYHDGLPGYSPAQILHDGCEECEERSREPEGGIVHLDNQNFARAWKRAADWNRFPGDGLDDIARAELPMLRILWAVQLKLDHRGVPIGQIPIPIEQVPGV
jgi:hypothetical protein